MSKYQSNWHEVSNLVEKWKPILGLGDWIITIDLKRESHPLGDGTEVEMEADVKYRQGGLTVYREFWDNEPEHREKNIVHELTHCLIARMHPFMAPAGDDALEEVTQQIAMAFHALEKGGSP